MVLKMKSIFHIQASTPEDVRQEVVKYFEDAAKQAESQREVMCKTKRDILAANVRIRAFENAATFWREIIIDPKPEAEK